MKELEKFLKDQGIKMLNSGTSGILPGSVLQKERSGYNEVGHLTDFFGGVRDKKRWTTFLNNDANIVYGTIGRKIDLTGRASINEFGLNITGGLKKVKSATYEIGEIVAREFLKQDLNKTGWMLLSAEVNSLRKTNKPAWKMANDKWITHQLFYATSFKIKFDVEGSMNLKAELDHELIKAEGGGSVSWGKTNELVISSNNKVPFGFKGWKV